MKTSANVIVYFNGDLLNTNESEICMWEGSIFLYSLYDIICEIRGWTLSMHRCRHFEDNGKK